MEVKSWQQKLKLRNGRENPNTKRDIEIDVVFVEDQEVIIENLSYAEFVLELLLQGEISLELLKQVGKFILGMRRSRL